MTITFQKESFIKLMPELPELFYEHWAELYFDKDEIPLDPDWARYAALELQGILHMITARDDGVLIGYYVGIVTTHIHFKLLLTAWSDMFYIHSDYRKTGKGMVSTGTALLKAVDKILKEMGVRKSYIVTSEKLPINILMRWLKYRRNEVVYTRLL